MSEPQKMTFFDDLVRNLYLNKIYTLALTAKMKNESTWYPSPENFLKLKTIPEKIEIGEYKNNLEQYAKMQEIDLLLRNYHIEINTAQQHFLDAETNDEVRQGDIDTLLFIPFYTIKRIMDTMDVFTNQNNQIRIITVILSEHLNNLAINYKRKEEWQKLTGTPPIAGKDKWLTFLTIRQTENRPLKINSGSLLYTDNSYLNDTIRQMVAEREIPEELLDLIHKETGSEDEIFNTTWNVFDLLPRAVAKDTVIEYLNIP